MNVDAIADTALAELRHELRVEKAENERVRDQQARLRRLLTRAMLYIPCEGPSTDPCVRCQISRTLSGASVHTYPDGTRR